MALLEFALVAPMLAVIVFGAVDLGRAYAIENRVKNMAKAGAAFAQANPSMFDTGGTDNCVQPLSVVYQALSETNPTSSLSDYTITETDLTASPNVVLTASGSNTSQCETTTFAAGDRVEVKVSTTFTLLTPLVGHLVGGQTLTVSGTQTVVVQ